jgi:hypothetical protein
MSDVLNQSNRTAQWCESWMVFLGKLDTIAHLSGEFKSKLLQYLIIRTENQVIVYIRETLVKRIHFHIIGKVHVSIMEFQNNNT